MFNAKFDDFLSKHRKTEELGFMLERAHPLNLGMFSASWIDSQNFTIFALRDAYLDEVTSASTCKKGEVLFRLNVGELERDVFKLEQEITLLELTERRLEDDYLADFIFKPLEAASDFANSNHAAAAEERSELRIPAEMGIIRWEEYLAAQDRQACAEALALKAKNDLVQRRIEIDGQKRRLKSQQSDLAKRIMITRNIAASYQYAASHDASVTLHTYAGAFVEEGDPILTLVV